MILSAGETGDLLSRIQGEYGEMPGLCLTLPQAQRLWGLDRSTCEEVLRALVQRRFLCQNADGAYARCDGTTIEPARWRRQTA